VPLLYFVIELKNAVTERMRKMPDPTPFEGTVVSLNPQQSGTLVKLSQPVALTFMFLEALLDFEHPGYSSAFSLLMASGAHQAPLTVYTIPNDPNPPVIQSVSMSF
jgi:hypothetical protein